MDNLLTKRRGNKTFLIVQTLEDELDTLACRMFEENSIPSLVPFAVLHRDGEVTIEYDITGLTPIADNLLSVVTKSHLNGILSSFINAFSILDEYFLDAEHIILRREHVYYNSITDKVAMVYLPVNTVPIWDTNALGLIADMLDSFKLDVRDREMERIVRSVIDDIRTGKIKDVEALKSVRQKLNASDENERNKADSNNIQYNENQHREAVKPQQVADGIRLENADLEKAPRDNQIKEKRRKKKNPGRDKQEYLGFDIPGIDRPIEEAEDVDDSYELDDVDGKDEKKQEKEKRFGFLFGKKKEKGSSSVEVESSEKRIENNLHSSHTYGYGDAINPYDKREVTSHFEDKARVVHETSGKEVQIKKYPFTIGRSSRSDLQLESEVVSGTHARINKVGVRYTVEDCKSLNHTWVNDEMIQPNTPYQIGHGDKIRFASTDTIRFYIY